MAHLIETSSIFSQNNSVPPENVEVRDNNKDGYSPVYEDQAKELKMAYGDLNPAIETHTIYPDTLVAIYYYGLLNCYVLGQISNEIFFEEEFDTVSPEIIGSEIVVMKCRKIGADYDNYIMYTNETAKFTECDLKDFKLNLDSVEYKGKEYSIISSESKKPEKHKLGTLYTYPTHSLIISQDRKKSYVLNVDNRLFLLSDEGGSYIGCVLPCDEESLVLLNGRKYNPLKRLTLMQTALEDFETKEVFLLTSAEQMLLPIKEFGYQSYKDIKVANGVLVLSEIVNEGTTVLHIFTPQHQKIVLEKGYKINTRLVGNGLVFVKDNVILLDSGALKFIKKGNQKNSILWDNIEYVLPTRYIGDNHV